MSNFFNDMDIGEALKESLSEVLEYEKGNLNLKTFIRLNIPELAKFSAEEIKNIRLDFNCTQNTFAKLLGVSKSTIEYWEAGKSSPSGSSSRMLALMKNKKETFIKEDLKLIGIF
jgi:putative transcriptional regulator